MVEVEDGRGRYYSYSVVDDINEDDSIAMMASKI